MRPMININEMMIIFSRNLKVYNRFGFENKKYSDHVIMLRRNGGVVILGIYFPHKVAEAVKKDDVNVPSVCSSG